MTSLICRCALKNVKRYVGTQIFNIYATHISNFRNLRLREYSFLSKDAFSTTGKELNLNKVADQFHSREKAKAKSIKSVEQAFNCTYEEAGKLVSDNQHLLHTLCEVSVSKMNVLQDIGITIQNIKENVWILSFSIDELHRYFHLIKKWEFKDINDAVSMLKLPLTKFEKYTIKMQAESLELMEYGNRIKYFVHHIQCSEKEACDKFAKCQFMFRIDAVCLKTNMEILLDVGCERSWLLRDVQDFRYAPKFLRERANKIKEIQDEGILDTVKPWMLRCKTDILERTCNIREEKHAVISPHTSVTDFLCDQLQLSPEKLEMMMAKHPPVRNVHVCKLKEIIDFLYVEGFNSDHIYTSPRVLCHSLVTLKERLKTLQDLGYTIKSLRTLCKNTKDFKELLDKLKEREKCKLVGPKRI